MKDTKRRKSHLSKKEKQRLKKQEEDEEIEYETWGDVIRELPIVLVITFLLIPLIYFAGASIVFAWNLFQQIWVYLLIIGVFLAIYIYFKYFR